MVRTGRVVELTSAGTAIYRRALELLQQAQVPFLVGGAYALARHTGIVRHTKDLDVFLCTEDCQYAMRRLAAAGFRTELTYPHWLGKAFRGKHFIDLIFSSGNGICQVDELWFDHALEAEIFGLSVLLCPPEEMIWSKAFIQERERFDGADVAHLLLVCGPRLDWDRLVNRFGPHGGILLSHLLLFGFIYPAERSKIPVTIVEQLWEKFRPTAVPTTHSTRSCLGTLLSREQYLVDIHEWGYQDAREWPRGPMSPDAIAHWTAAIDTGR